MDDDDDFPGWALIGLVALTIGAVIVDYLN